MNRRALLANTLEGYRRYAPYEGTELVIVDYGSTDNVEGILQSAREIFERVRYVLIDRSKSKVPINPTYNNPAVALNVAIRIAEAPFLMMSPPECYPLADTIRVAREVMKEGAREGCLLGKALRTTEAITAIMENGRWLPRTEAEVRARIPKVKLFVVIAKDRGAFRLAPFFMAFRKDDHERLNGFDEEYVRGWGAEDTDYLTRLKQLGREVVWEDRCVVMHQWHPSTGPAPHGTAPGWPNWRRDGLRANPDHEPGSLNLIVKNIVL